MEDDKYDVQLPSAVRRNDERADKLAKQMLGGDQVNDGQATSQDGEGRQPGPQPENPPAPPAETPPQKPADGPTVFVHEGQQYVPLADFNALLHKFRSLDGKINAENPRLKKRVDHLFEENRELAQKNDALESEKKDLESRLQEALSNKGGTDTGGGRPVEGEIDPDEFERYGPEFQKLATGFNRLAKQNDDLIKINQKQADIIERIGAGKGSVQHVDKPSAADQNRNSRLKFYVEDIQTLVTESGYKTVDAEKLGSDPAFNTWLDNTVDEQYGLTMRTIMKGHNAQYNADGASKVILKYLKSTAGTAADRRTPPVEPGKPLPSGAEAGIPARVWTSADINRFYRDWREGRISDIEAQKIEQDIILSTQGAAFRR